MFPILNLNLKNLLHKFSTYGAIKFFEIKLLYTVLTLIQDKYKMLSFSLFLKKNSVKKVIRRPFSCFPNVLRFNAPIQTWCNYYFYICIVIIIIIVFIIIIIYYNLGVGTTLYS